MALGGAAAFDGFEALVAELLRHLLEPLGQRRQRSDVGQVSFGERVAAHADKERRRHLRLADDSREVLGEESRVDGRRHQHEAQVAVLREQPPGEEAEHVGVDRPVVALVDDEVGDARKVVGAVRRQAHEVPVVQYHSRVRLPSSRVPWPIRSPTRWPYPVSTARLCSACAARRRGCDTIRRGGRPPPPPAIFPASSSIIGTRDDLPQPVSPTMMLTRCDPTSRTISASCASAAAAPTARRRHRRPAASGGGATAALAAAAAVLPAAVADGRRRLILAPAAAAVQHAVVLVIVTHRYRRALAAAAVALAAAAGGATAATRGIRQGVHHPTGVRPCGGEARDGAAGEAEAA